MSAFDFRAYLKPKGSNPEIDSAFYELSSQEFICGIGNCEVLSLGFRRETFSKQTVFRPIDRSKPVVFAISDSTKGCYFVVVDGHTRGKRHGRMLNLKPFKTDDYFIDCYDANDILGRDREYWAIKVAGETYVYSKRGSFPGTWVVEDLDLLCDFVAGVLTANQLRAAVYRQGREAEKEERREEHIRRLACEKKSITADAAYAVKVAVTMGTEFSELVSKLFTMTESHWPWLSRDKVYGAVRAYEPFKKQLEDVVRMSKAYI